MIKFSDASVIGITKAFYTFASAFPNTDASRECFANEILPPPPKAGDQNDTMPARPGRLSNSPGL